MALLRESLALLLVLLGQPQKSDGVALKLTNPDALYVVDVHIRCIEPSCRDYYKLIKIPNYVVVRNENAGVASNPTDDSCRPHRLDGNPNNELECVRLKSPDTNIVYVRLGPGAYLIEVLQPDAVASKSNKAVFDESGFFEYTVNADKTKPIPPPNQFKAVEIPIVHVHHQ
jgi:hypothetical protein